VIALAGNKADLQDKRKVEFEVRGDRSLETATALL
jgi:hypothetical protein